MKILKGAKILSKQEQQSINGGRRMCNIFGNCHRGYCCYRGSCFPEGSDVCEM